MRISNEIPVNATAAQFSPCGGLLAFGFSNALTVIRTLDRVTVFGASCSGKIKAVDWSPDCDRVLCVIQNKGSVEAFSVSQPKWTCAIREKACGLHSAFWSPRARHIVTIAEHAVRLSVWSLIGRSVTFIETPLMKAKEGLAFSPDGRSLAVIMGRFEEYAITLYSTSSWTVSRRIPCTNEISIPSGPLWSPDSRHVAIWEKLPFDNSILEVYSVEKGGKIGHFRSKSKGHMDGISSVVWCLNGQFLLIGCRDERIYVLNYITWGVIGAFSHRKVVEDGSCPILQEQPGGEFVKLLERPVKFTFGVTRPTRLPGVVKICFSSEGVHVASQTALLPAVVWLWNLEEFALMTIVVFSHVVTDMGWSPSKRSLLVCGNSSRVNLWRGGKVSRMDLGVPVRRGVWSTRGAAEGGKFLLFTPSSLFIVSNFE